MKLFNKIRSLSRKGKLAVAVLALGVGVSLPLAVQAEFFPNRPTYDYNKTNPGGDCANPANPAAQYGRCGSMNGPVFNSFINTPSYGDERSFVDARRSDQIASGSYKNVLPNVTDGSKEIVVRMYVHNNANSATNASGKGIAKNTKVRLALPTTENDALRAVGYISADNAAPQVVEDTVDFTSHEKFTVNYKAGSAIMYNNGPLNGSKLSDSIVTTGAPIGFDQLNGNLPGCFDYEAVVQVTLTVTPKPATNLQLAKEVKKVGSTTWSKEVTTKPGDEVQWLLTTKNIGNADLTKVQVRDILPPHVQLVPNSVRIIDANQDTKQADAPLFGNGLGLGTYPRAGGRYVIFNTKTLGDFDACETRVRNVAKAHSDQTPEIESKADVVIKKENCNVTTPVFACDLLTAEKGENRTVKFTTTASASNGATIKDYSYDFGDGQTVTTGNTVTHTYGKDGEFTARVKVNVMVGNETKVAESQNCVVKVKFEKTPEVPVFACDLLTAEKGTNRTVKFTAKASASNGATIKNYAFDFGDGQTFTTDQNTVTHTYAKDGQFAARVKVNVGVGNETKVAEGDKCAVAVSFTTPSTPGTPTTPTTLPATGAGSTIAIFAAVTAASAAAYFAVARRFNV